MCHVRSHVFYIIIHTFVTLQAAFDDPEVCEPDTLAGAEPPPASYTQGAAASGTGSGMAYLSVLSGEDSLTRVPL